MADVIPPTPDRFALGHSPSPMATMHVETVNVGAPKRKCGYLIPALVGVSVALVVVVAVHLLRKKDQDKNDVRKVQGLQYAAGGAARPFPRNIPAFPPQQQQPQQPGAAAAGAQGTPEAYAGAGNRFSSYQAGDAQRAGDVAMMLDKRYNQPQGMPYNDNRMPAYENYSEAISGLGRVQHLGEEAFNKRVLQQKQPALVAFVMDGCGHCERMKPNFDEAARNAKIALIMIERGQAGALPQKYGVRGFPTIALFRGGELVKMYSGDRSAQSLAEFANA